MPKARPAGRLDDGAYDAGTLWRMTRNGCGELRVMVICRLVGDPCDG